MSRVPEEFRIGTKRYVKSVGANGSIEWVLVGDIENWTKNGVVCQTCNEADDLIKKSGLSVLEFAKILSGYLKNPAAKEPEDVHEAETEEG